MKLLDSAGMLAFGIDYGALHTRTHSSVCKAQKASTSLAENQSNLLIEWYVDCVVVEHGD